MEKREARRQKLTHSNGLYATLKARSQTLKLAVLDISIGGLGLLVERGFSLLQKGEKILIETLEKDGTIIATSIDGKVAYLGPGVPTRVGIEFSPADTPIQAFTELHHDGTTGMVIRDRDEILNTFEEIKKWSRGSGDMLMIYKTKAIPAEFFYIRPKEGTMLLRIVRISELRLPYQPQPDTIYPFYLFKGIYVIFFTTKILGTVKNIMEAEIPLEIKYISRRNVMRYLITGHEPITARLKHPLNSEKVNLFIWDISIEGMGAEVIGSIDIPFIPGMKLQDISIELPTGTIETAAVVRSVRREDVVDKTYLGLEFNGAEARFKDAILSFILKKDFPSDVFF